MGARDRLLRHPDAAFVEAMRLMHQDLNRVDAAGLGIGDHLMTFMAPEMARSLVTYLDGLLADPLIDNSDLRALAGRHQTNWGIPSPKVRGFLVDLRVAAERRVENG